MALLIFGQKNWFEMDRFKLRMSVLLDLICVFEDIWPEILVLWKFDIGPSVVW